VAISIRAQILAAALALFVPVAGVIYLFSWATYTEQRSYLSDEAGRIALALASGGAADVSTALPGDSRIVIADRAGGVTRGTPPTEPAVFLSGSAQTVDGGSVTVFLPEVVAWNRTWQIYQRNYLVVVCVTLLAMVIVIFLSRRWRLGLRALELHARRIGARDTSPITWPRMPSSELISLQRSLAEMEQNLASLERQVVRQERLAAIGVLASGIAHEVNNPLQAIAGRAQLVLHDPALSASARADIDVVQREAARASGIIRNLSRFSRQDDAPPTRFRLSEVVAWVVELRQGRLGELGVHIVRDETAQADVMGVVTEFQQVLLNFVVNAEQAMATIKRGPKTLTIRTRDRDGWVACEVEDTGPGVSPEDEPKLFQPFFTTKPVGEGTGLGLSVSHNIISAFGGRIGYRPGETGGAVMWFEVPAAR
jgi:C4-dicarboxylate-specific signal transduction histidine kinase